MAETIEDRLTNLETTAATELPALDGRIKSVEETGLPALADRISKLETIWQGIETNGTTLESEAKAKLDVLEAVLETHGIRIPSAT